MINENERREECKSHIERTKKLEIAMFGEKRDGLAYEMVNVIFTNRIILGLQVATIAAIVKILITGK